MVTAASSVACGAVPCSSTAVSLVMDEVYRTSTSRISLPFG